MRRTCSIVLAVAGLGACGGDGAAGPDAAPGQADAAGTADDPAWPAARPIEAPFDFGPWLTMPEPNRIVVSFRTTLATTALVRHGTSPDYGESASSDQPTELHHVDLGVLEPATAYHYQVDVEGATREGVFTTPGRERWRFIHQAEFHAPSLSVFVALSADAIRAFRPHVVVESGDMVDDGDDLAHWRDYFRTAAPWISNVILLPAGSNHVQGAGGNDNLLELFVLPGNERWYATRYGSVQFLTLDSTFDSNADISDDEPPWVAARAAEAHDGDDDPEFLVSAWHYPACSSSYASRNQIRDWVMANFIDTFADNGGLDLALVGHDKYYERSTIDGGIVHVQSNIGKISPGDPGSNRAECTPVVTETDTRSVPMFEVEPGLLRARVIDAEGNEIDRFTIESE